LCLLTEDNDNPIIIRPHIVFTDGRQHPEGSVKVKCLEISRLIFHSYHNSSRFLCHTCKTIYFRHRKYIGNFLRTVQSFDCLSVSFYDMTSIDANTIAVSTGKCISIANMCHTCKTIYFRHRKYMKIDLYLLLESRLDWFWSSNQTVEFLH
jgi:hypothetical protein